MLASVLACSRSADDGAKRLSGTDEAGVSKCAPGIEPLPSRIKRGMCVAHNYQANGLRGYGSTTSAATLAELKTLGVESVSLTPFGFMKGLDEPTVHPIGNYRAGETDARMKREIAQAKKLGLHVVLKPHIWVADGRWRGEIAFERSEDWNRWFDAYERWILAYADLAQAQGVDLLVVGVELRSTESRLERRWRRLVRRVRRRFKGDVTYSANWDDAASLPWWDDLDAIGVQFYPPLSDRADADTTAVRTRLDEELDTLGTIASEVGLPVILTEVGYRSASEALVHPHAWPERARDNAVDPDVQTNAYRALIEEARTRPWLAGIYWWKWFTDPHTTEEGPAGFSPRNKPAENVLRAAYGGICNAPSRVR